MKSIQCLFTISFLAFTLNTLVFAEGDGGGDGGGDSGGDGGDDYDGNGHYDGDGHHHDHGHHHNNFILGIGGFYDPWLWGGYYGPGMWRSYYGPGFWGPYGYRGYGYGYADPFFRPYYTYPSAVAAPSQPPIYIQQQEPKHAQPKTDYWHYCQDPQGYYPYIRECPSGWLQITPQPNTQR